MALEGISRHPDLWYDDGTVILIAESTGFRVYQGLLSKHSNVFRDMFSLPQPTATARDTYEGCPIVRLMNDIAEEMAEVLKILHDGCQSFYNQDQKTSFSTVEAVLRIGTKYDFSMLRQEALRRISVCFPATLAALQSGLRACPFTWDRTASLAIVHLSHSFDLLEAALPAAVYKCVTQYTASELFSNTVSTPHTNNKTPYYLTMEDFRILLEVREYLVSRRRSIDQIFANCKTSPGCEDYPRCIGAMKVMVCEYHNRLMNTDCDALHGLEAWISRYTKTKKQVSILSALGPQAPRAPDPVLCRACVDDKKSMVKDQQKETWLNLRTKFGASINSEDESPGAGPVV